MPRLGKQVCLAGHLRGLLERRPPTEGLPALCWRRRGVNPLLGVSVGTYDYDSFHLELYSCPIRHFDGTTGVWEGTTTRGIPPEGGYSPRSSPRPTEAGGLCRGLLPPKGVVTPTPTGFARWGGGGLGVSLRQN